MNKILEIKFGSNLYGTQTPNSDLDLKAIYLPASREILLNSYKKTISTTRPKKEFERNNKDDVDIEIFSLDRYLELLLQGQTVALDILFAPLTSYTFHNPELLWIMQYIYNNRFEFLSKNVNAFMCYAKNQAAKYGQKGFRVHALRSTLEWLKNYAEHLTLLDIGHDVISRWITETDNEHIKIIDCKGPNNTVMPHLEVCNKKIPFHATVKYAKQHMQRRFDEYGKRALMAEANIGVDWKALSHSVRVNGEAYELLTTGNITFPRPDKDLLLKIKLGELPYKEVAEMIEDGLGSLKEVQQKSILRESPNVEFAEDLIVRVYSDIVSNS